MNLCSCFPHLLSSWGRIQYIRRADNAFGIVTSSVGVGWGKHALLRV
jgi:hypothetical protein